MCGVVCAVRSGSAPRAHVRCPQRENRRHFDFGGFSVDPGLMKKSPIESRAGAGAFAGRTRGRWAPAGRANPRVVHRRPRGRPPSERKSDFRREPGRKPLASKSCKLLPSSVDGVQLNPVKHK